MKTRKSNHVCHICNTCRDPGQHGNPFKGKKSRVCHDCKERITAAEWKMFGRQCACCHSIDKEHKQ